MPVQPAFVEQCCSKKIRQRLEIASVITSVNVHSLREWPGGPVCLLRTFLQSYSQMFVNQMSQAKLPMSQKTRCFHRIENTFRHEAIRAPQHPKIVVGAVENQFLAGKDLKHWNQVQAGQWVDQFICAWEA